MTPAQADELHRRLSEFLEEQVGALAISPADVSVRLNVRYDSPRERVTVTIAPTPDPPVTTRTVRPHAFVVRVEDLGRVMGYRDRCDAPDCGMVRGAIVHDAAERAEGRDWQHRRADGAPGIVERP